MLPFTGPPETPKEFTAHQGSEKPSSISFTWFPGFHGDADQTFHIEYRSEGHDWKEGARVFGGKVLEQQLQTYVDGLESGSSYLFRIYASNKYGNSDKSQERLGRTVEGQTSEAQYCISVEYTNGSLSYYILLRRNVSTFGIPQQYETDCIPSF